MSHSDDHRRLHTGNCFFSHKRVIFFLFHPFFNFSLTHSLFFLSHSLHPTSTLSTQYSLFPHSSYSHSLPPCIFTSTHLFPCSHSLYSSYSCSFFFPLYMHIIFFFPTHLFILFYTFLFFNLCPSYTLLFDLLPTFNLPSIYFLSLYSSNYYTPFSLLHFLLLLPAIYFNSLHCLCCHSLVFPLPLTFILTFVPYFSYSLLLSLLTFSVLPTPILHTSTLSSSTVYIP